MVSLLALLPFCRTTATAGLNASDQFTTVAKPALAVSLLFNEEPVWFKEWITLTHAALALVDHCIIVSVSPDTYGGYRATLDQNNMTGCVLFSPPSAKYKWGLDLLRGHVANIRHAHQHFPQFTHAVLAASNNMWIQKPNASWPGFSLGVTGECLPISKCNPGAVVREMTVWNWPALKSDVVFWDFAFESNLTVCNGQSEGFFASKQAWLTAISFLHPLLLHNPAVYSSQKKYIVGYPAEEIYFPTAFCNLHLARLQSSKGPAVRWLDGAPLPNKTDIIQARAEGYLMVKRIPREPGSELIGHCRENQF